MSNKLEYKGLECKVEDLEKGMVKFVANVAGNVDLGDDRVTSPDSYKETVNSAEDQKRLKHFREHDSKTWVGFPTLSIEGNNLMATSKLMLKRADGLDTYELYKAAAEAGRSVEHSIGYKAIDFDFSEENGSMIRNINKMMVAEVSTLSAWGMNPLADQFQVKSMDINKLLVEEKFFNELLNAKFDDIKLEGIERLKNKIEAEIKNRQPKSWLNYIK